MPLRPRSELLAALDAMAVKPVEPAQAAEPPTVAEAGDALRRMAASAPADRPAPVVSTKRARKATKP